MSWNGLALLHHQDVHFHRFFHVYFLLHALPIRTVCLFPIHAHTFGLLLHSRNNLPPHSEKGKLPISLHFQIVLNVFAGYSNAGLFKSYGNFNFRIWKWKFVPRCTPFSSLVKLEQFIQLMRPFLQISFFMIEVLHSSPKITPMGLFDMDLCLLPIVSLLLNLNLWFLLAKPKCVNRTSLIGRYPKK